MVGKPKDVNIKNVIDTVVDRTISDLGSKHINWDALWVDVWDVIVDELYHFGLFVKDDTMPIFPEAVLKSKDRKKTFKELLLQVINERMK